MIVGRRFFIHFVLLNQFGLGLVACRGRHIFQSRQLVLISGSALCQFGYHPVNAGKLGVASGEGFFDYEGRSALEMQDERDRHLYRVLNTLGEYVSGPRPVR